MASSSPLLVPRPDDSLTRTAGALTSAVLPNALAEPTLAEPTAPEPGVADAAGVARGIARLFARNEIWCLPEMPLRNARRADLMGVDAKGRVIIVEIKVSKADLLGDNKWPEYLDYCDRFYWGLSPALDCGIVESEAFMPERCGLIIADEYDAEILRPAASHPLAAARRKVEVERLARAAMRRLTCGADENCADFLRGQGNAA